MTGEQQPVWRIVAAKLRDAMKGFGTGNERAAFYAESIPRQNLTSAANAGNYLRPRFGTSLRSDRRKFIAVCGILLRCSWFDDPGGEFMATEALLEQILKLPVDERAELARQVLLSLEPEEFDDEIEHSWATEIRRRREAVRCGDVKLLDWVDARQQILDELNQARSV